MPSSNCFLTDRFPQITFPCYGIHCWMSALRRSRQVLVCNHLPFFIRYRSVGLCAEEKKLKMLQRSVIKLFHNSAMSGSKFFISLKEQKINIPAVRKWMRLVVVRGISRIFFPQCTSKSLFLILLIIQMFLSSKHTYANVVIMQW